ncbi:MAG: LUD domain-containing protein, partial [Planctomycetota bacterium]
CALPISEELQLNTLLESAGVEVVETDLGERIIQLANEAPAHIVAPSIEFDRDRVTGLFQQHLAQPPTRDIGELTRQARRTLRESFRTADCGITGANFLIAETGSLVIVTNEGNGRMCASLPRLHIAIVGIEKVVETLADLGPLQRALMRGSTGQAFTSYMQIISGPRAPGEPDGPDELHIVLLDGGRSAIRADETFADVLRCVRCSSCINVCPVYNRAGARAYGWVYPGPVGTVLTSLNFTERMSDLAEACSLCGHCTAVCPVGIDLEQMHLDLRARLHAPAVTDKENKSRDREGADVPASAAVAAPAPHTSANGTSIFSLVFALYAWLARHPSAWQRIFRLARVGGLLASLVGLRRRIWFRRVAPLPARESFQQWWAREGSHLTPATLVAPTAAASGANTAPASTPATAPAIPADELFAQRLIAAGGQVITDLASYFADCRHTGDVLIDGIDDDAPLVATITAAAHAAGRTVHTSRATLAGRDALFNRTAVGITRAWRALADTGTVLEPGDRLASLVPPASLVVLHRSRLRPDIATVLAELPRPLPTAVTFITGPSRTADIEQTLTIGVHGPLEMAVWIVD